MGRIYQKVTKISIKRKANSKTKNGRTKKRIRRKK